MAKIYSAPKSLEDKLPSFVNFDRETYFKQEEEYRSELKKILLNRKKGKNVGEIVRFPVADSHAEYMVASMRPLELVHVPLGDAWDFEYAHLLTAKEINQKIEQQKALKKLFSNQ